MPSKLVETVSFRSGEDEISNSFLSGLAQVRRRPSRRSLVLRFIASFSEPSTAPSYEILDETILLSFGPTVNLLDAFLRGSGRARERAKRDGERGEGGRKGYGMSGAYSLQII